MALKDFLATGYGWVLARAHRPGPEPKIVVMVPFVGPENSDDWARDCAVLGQTLDAVRRQSYGNFDLILSSQARPPDFPDDPRFHFVQAPPHRAAANVSDQNVKVRLMARFAARRFKGFAYVHHLDGDDIPHPDLFAHVARDNNGRGYLIDSGYMMEAGTARLAPLGPDVAQGKPFWLQCGSCAFFAVDWSRQIWPVAYLRLIGKGHKGYGARARRLGYPLDPVPFAAMLYVVNHGGNMQNRKGNSKLGYLNRLEITDPDIRARILADFHMPVSVAPAP